MIEEHNKPITAGEPLHDEGSGPILMESGSIRPDGDDCGECRISRGMPVVSTDGHEIGWVAAVEMDTRGASTNVLLARPKTTLEYYVLSPALIRSVNDGQVLLGIRAEAAWSLPPRNVCSTP